MKLKNSALQELYDVIVKSTITISPYAVSPIDEAFRECDEKLSDSITFALIKDLQDRCDIFEKSNGTLLQANLDLATKKRKLEKDLDDAKNQLKYFTDSRDAWRSRAKHAENEVEELKKDNNDLEKRLIETTETLEKVNSDRNSYRDLYTELRKAYDKLYEENRMKFYKTWELKARLNSIYGKGPDYEDCFNAMIDGFETMTCPYLYDVAKENKK